MDALNQAVTALNTLKQSTQSASNQTGSTNNDTASKQDALKLLADFAKANPDNLTPDQQKQLSDILAAQKDGKGVSQAQLNGLIDSLNSSIKSQYTEEVRATGNGPTLPNSSLYNIDPNNPNGYLVETDPAFANYKKWLSSDYMMQRLGLDPSNMHKRLGDGYYEQGLIRDQVMTLTGRRFLGDYTTDDAMYQALMDNGVATAKAINLRPGIALTAEQMAQLTTDIVWLVEQTITLKDGTKQTVLVPKVYVRSKVGDLKGDSSLIAARNMDMQLTGDLTNQGNIVAHNGLRIQANNLNNQNGGVIQGNFVQVNTKNDLNNLGATLKANNAMALDVGGKLNNSSTTYHTESKLGQSNAWRTGIDQIGQIYVGDGLKGKTDDNGRPLTTLSIDVGGNATFNAGQLINQGGTTRLIAQGDVALNAVNTGYQTNAIKDGNNYTKSGQTHDIGSVVASQGSTYIQSKGGSITGTAVTIHSEDGSSYLDANKGITLKEGRATSNLETAIKTTEKSLLSRKTTQDRYSQTSDEAIQSNIEGNTVVMDAGRDIHLTATRGVSDSGTALTAGHDVTIDAAQNRYRESSSHNEKKSGIFGANSGIGFTIGSQKQSMDNQRNVVTHTGSTVGAIDGNVVINAGNHYQQTASDVVAGMGADTGKGVVDPNRGNIDITAKSADIVNATATEDNQSQQKFKQSGLTVSVSNGLVDQYNSINGLIKAGENADSDRMKAMAGISAGLKAQNAIKGVAQAQDPVTAATSGRIQATLGSQSSQSNNQSHTQTNEAATVNAAGNFSIKATGAGKDSNINIVGSQLKAGNNGSLITDNEVNILASSQQDTHNSQNKAQGFGVGVYATGSASGKTGAGITLNANTSRGSGDGESTHYTNSQIDVGNTFSLTSGGDTNIRGGVINAKRAEGSVGGNLNIESMQNKETYTGKQRSAGFSADIDMVGGNSTNLSVNGGKTNVNSDYVGVNQQSGIFTGDGGFNINVEGKTTLTGGAITTTDKAKQQGLNQFTSKGGIETLDLENHAQYEGNAIQAGFSLNGSKATQDPQKVDPNLKTSWNGKTTGIGYGKAGDNQTSVTKAGITGVAGQAEITTDNKSDYAGVIKNNFDNNKIMQQLGSQTQITQAFGQEAPKAIGDYAKEKTKPYEYAQMVEGQLTDALTKTTDPEQRQVILSNLAKVQAYKQQHEQDYNNWKEGGAYRVAAHTAIGALGGGTVQSALTAGGTAVAAPMITEVEKKIADNLAKQGIDATTASSIANSLTGLTLTGIGASAGLDVGSTATAVNIDANNRQLHPYEVDLINQNAKLFAKNLNGGKEPTVAQIQDARKRLTFQALKQIDSSWNSLISTNDIAAHNFLENLAKTSKSVNSGKVFTANDKDKNNQSVNSASIYHNRDNYNLYSLNGVRGSYIALDLAVSDYKDWKGKGLNEYKAVANSNFRQLASEIQNPYEQMAFGEAERSFYETAVNVGGYKPGSKENNALLPYYIHGSFSSPLPLETAGNARLPNSGAKVNGKLPTTTGNRTSVNVTTNSAGRIINRDTKKYTTSPFKRHPASQQNQKPIENGTAQPQVQVNQQYHDQANLTAKNDFANQNVRVTTEVTFRNPNKPSETARIDQVLNGNPNQVLIVPKGFTAVDLKTGKQITSIKLDTRGQAGVEIKTGDAKLERNQPTVFTNCINGSGCAVGTGNNAQSARVNGTSPQNIYILIKK